MSINENEGIPANSVGASGGEAVKMFDPKLPFKNKKINSLSLLQDKNVFNSDHSHVKPKKLSHILRHDLDKETKTIYNKDKR